MRRLLLLFLLFHCPACRVLQDSLDHSWGDRYPVQEAKVNTVETSGFSGTSIITVVVTSKETPSHKESHKLLCRAYPEAKTRVHSWVENGHCQGAIDTVTFNVHHEVEVLSGGQWRKIGRVPALSVRSRKRSSVSGLFIYGFAGLFDMALFPLEIPYILVKDSIPCADDCPAVHSTQAEKETCHVLEELK